MKTRNMVLCLLALFAASLCAQEKVEISYRLYQIGGRKWTIKAMPNPGGDGNLNINYTVYEVLAVHADYALVSMMRLDEHKKVPKGVEPTEFKVFFKPDVPPFKPPEGDQWMAQETVKIAGQSFECDIWSGGTPAVKSWRAKRFPGLIVKVEAGFGRDELTEFDWFKDDDPPAKKPKDPPKEDPPPDALNFALYKSSKRSWIVHEKGPGGVPDVHKKFEVSKVDAGGADLKITEVDAATKKPLKGAKPEIKRVEFSEKGKEFIAPPGGKLVRTEKRKFGSGVMECDVYEATVDGKSGQVWMAKKYPGLVVRMWLGQGAKDGFAELVEFKE